MNTNATNEFLRYHGLRKEQTNPYYKNYKVMKVDKTMENIVFGAHKTPGRFKKRIMKGYTPERRKRGRPKKRWVQDITDDLHISALNAGHLAYDLSF
jgi:hypothetical protein